MEKYQTFLPRFVALVIDAFIMLPIAISDDWFRQAEFPPLFFYFWIPISILIFPLYSILMHGIYGQTLGKMAMNVKVLDVSEEPLKFSQAIWRELPQLIFNFASIVLGIVFLNQDAESAPVKNSYMVYTVLAAIWGFADIFVFLTDSKRRALHDYIAGSVVVRTNL